MDNGTVFDIQRFSIHDGPGIRTSVFLKGCPLRCLWCCNPEGQKSSPEVMEFYERCIGCGECIKACPVLAITKTTWKINRDLCINCGKCAEVCPSKAREVSGKLLSAEEVFKEIQKDEAFFRESEGGVTFTGGEPSFQPQFVNKLLMLCKENNIHTAIETCGYSEKNIFLEMINNADLLLFDLKQVNPWKHMNCTGVNNWKILDNLKTIFLEKRNFILRIPVIPNYTDGMDNIAGIAKIINNFERKNIIEIQLLPYHALGESKYERLGRVYKLKGLPLLSKDKLFNIKVYLESLVHVPVTSGQLNREHPEAFVN